MMTQLSQTTMDQKKCSRVEAGPGPAAAERERLEALVSELLKTNQELRFKAAALEDEVDRLKRGLAHATAWAGMAF